MPGERHHGAALAVLRVVEEDLVEHVGQGGAEIGSFADVAGVGTVGLEEAPVGVVGVQDDESQLQGRKDV